jgi:hypothetical protein
MGLHLTGLVDDWTAGPVGSDPTFEGWYFFTIRDRTGTAHQ